MNDTVMAQAEKRIAALALENKQLRKEAARLRARVAPGRTHRIVTRAYEDARRILHYRHAGVPAGRRWMSAAGLMTQRQHGWAIALLRVARLEDVTPASIEHLDQCIHRLEVLARDIIEHEDMDRLRARGNCNIRMKR